jgi:dsRNA-specific ribonuclease
MREFCAEGAKKKGWHKLATVGKCFKNTKEEVTTNMQAELFEAIWGALFIDTEGHYEGARSVCF